MFCYHSNTYYNSNVLYPYQSYTCRDYPDVLYLVENAVTAELTSCDIVGISCTVNTVHYCLNADGVVAISNKVCNVVHVYILYMPEH